MWLIKNYIFVPILWLMSFLPIEVIRMIGSFIGSVGVRLSKKARNRMKNNLLITNIANQDNVNQLALRVAQELGKTLVETICLAWNKNRRYCYNLVKSWGGFELVEEAQQHGKSIIFLTPHIGNFEIMVKATAFRLEKRLTILYKPSKDKWFHQLMLKGRTEVNINPVPTNNRGVIQLIRALKNGENIGVLPDSVASQSDGVWVDFFNNKVFATTLLAKIINSTPSSEIFIVSNNRVRGGFQSEFIPYKALSNDTSLIVQDIYNKIEDMVKKYPMEYFWSYDRFRTPDHVKAGI